MPPPGASILGSIASYGLPGLIIALFAVWLYLKDRELKAERDARIEDAKSYTQLALKLQADVLAAVNKLSDIFEAVQRRRGP